MPDSISFVRYDHLPKVENSQLLDNLPFVRRWKTLRRLYPDRWIPFPRWKDNDFI